MIGDSTRFPFLLLGMRYCPVLFSELNGPNYITLGEDIGLSSALSTLSSGFRCVAPLRNYGKSKDFSQKSRSSVAGAEGRRKTFLFDQ